jgi:hypothetical protein
MTFARLVLAASTNDPVPEPRKSNLPPRQAAYAIAQYYMSNIFPLFPAFSDTALMGLLDKLYQDDQPPIKSSDSWLFWMVLATGSTAQSRTKDDEYYRNGVEFVAHALPHADRALMPGYVTQIQALLLLTQYSMFDPAHFDSWQLISFTCRAVVDLGFHQDPLQAQSADKAAIEARRKTFYCVYSLDRFVSTPLVLSQSARPAWLMKHWSQEPLAWSMRALFPLQTMPFLFHFRRLVAQHVCPLPARQWLDHHPTMPPSPYSSYAAYNPAGTNHSSNLTRWILCPTPLHLYGTCVARCENGPPVCPIISLLAFERCSTLTYATATCTVSRPATRHHT